MNSALDYAGKLSQMIQKKTVTSKTESKPDYSEDFLQLLKTLFPHLFEKITLEDFDGSFLFCLKGSGKGNPVLFMNHYDVVPDETGWSRDAFGGEIDGEYLWGRGTLDTKGGLFCMLQAAEELCADGFVPKRDIYFESSRNEETTGAGAMKIAKTLSERGIVFDMILDEGGIIIEDLLDDGAPAFAMVGLGEKCYNEIKFTAKSNGGHASMPGKNSPFVRLGKFMTYIESHPPFKAKMTPGTAKMLKTVAPYMGGAVKIAGSHPEFFAPLITRLLPALMPSVGATMMSTVAFTMSGGAEFANVMPDAAYVIANVRFACHDSRDESIEKLKKIAEKFDIETEVVDLGIETGVSEADGEYYGLIEKATDYAFNSENARRAPGRNGKIQPVRVAPYMMSAASDCRFFDGLSDNCFHFVPFLAKNELIDTIHGKDERVPVASLPPAVDFYKYLYENV